MKKDLIGKAKIKDGAVVGVDFSFVTWKDNGEIFDVYTFNEDRKELIADGYGNLDKPNAYGSGALFVKNTDVIFCIEPLDVATIPAEVMRVEESIVNKLNEVIEAVNKMMEVMNKG